MHTIKRSLFVLGLSLSATVLYAQEEEIPSESSSMPSPISPNGGTDSGTRAKESGELPPPVLPHAKEFTAAEKKKECAKYEGAYISYYEHIYRVEKCRRREFLVEEGKQSPLLAGVKNIKSVGTDTVAMLPEGTPLNAAKKNSIRGCAQLNNHYIISGGDDIYYVEKCRKHLFPDTDTYSDHAKKHGKRDQDVLEVSDEELMRVPDGTPIPSSLDAEYKKLLDADTGVDVIPLAEACKGLNGKFVAYYSKVYFIEKCRKKPVDPILFGQRYPKVSPQELNSEQWISIPTGTDYKIR